MRKRLNENKNYSVYSINTVNNFCHMVADYIKYCPEDIEEGIFNYGEMDWFYKNYPNLIELCMAGDNEVADAADGLVDAISNFVNVIDRNRDLIYRGLKESKGIRRSNKLNEISIETLRRAADKADKLDRPSQRKVFTDEITRRYKERRSNSIDKKYNIKTSFDCVFEYGEKNDYYYAVYVDKNYPIVIQYKCEYNGEICWMDVITTPDYKHINNELQDIVKVFFNEYKDLIKPNNNDIFLTFTDETNNIFDSYSDVKFYDKKDARAFVNAVRVVNKKLNTKYNDDWHNYYDYSE